MAMKGMTRVTLKGLLAHKLRLSLTALSVVLGVAFVSETLVLTDTMRHTFDELFGEVLADVDVSVRAKSGFTEGETSADTARDTLPESLVDTVSAVPGVKVAAGAVGGYAQIITPEGNAITTSGAPTLGLNWSTNTELLPAPEGPTRATISPGATMRLKSCRAGWSGRLGYQKVTRSSSMRPSGGSGSSAGTAGTRSSSASPRSYWSRSIDPVARSSRL